MESIVMVSHEVSDAKAVRIILSNGLPFCPTDIVVDESAVAPSPSVDDRWITR